MDKQKFNEVIGERVQRRRKTLGYTREHTAELANISVQFLFDIEKGKKSMTALTIVNLAEALSVSIDYLLLGPGKDGENKRAELEQMLVSLVPEQRELAEEMLRLFVRGVSINGKVKKI